jgi:endonuclease-8
MPEGPSLVIAVEELEKFRGQRIAAVEGNSKAGIQRLAGETLREIFSYGKRLNFQFDAFALRIHFMLWGSYRVDEPRENREPRLVMRFRNGTIYMYACAVQFVETAALHAEYDFRTDIMSPQWDRRYVTGLVRLLPAGTTVDDVLMNQEIFTGVGNIIKNEVLWRQRLLPSHPIGELTSRKLSLLVGDAREFSRLFYEWKKVYELKKHYQIYRKGVCPRCGGKVVHRKTGRGQRLSHFCPVCQV